MGFEPTSSWCSGYHTRLVTRGDVGTNPTEADFPFTPLFSLYMII